MTTTTHPERATAKESIKVLRETLRTMFPATTFRVRMDRGTAYGFVSVSWTDGPTAARVQCITEAFAGEGFDGMTDSTFSTGSLLPDGRRSGLRMVNTHRHLSDAFVAKCITRVGTYFAVPCERWPTADQYRCGGISMEALTINGGYRDDWYTHITRAAGDASLYA